MTELKDKVAEKKVAKKPVSENKKTVTRSKTTKTSENKLNDNKKISEDKKSENKKVVITKVKIKPEENIKNNKPTIDKLGRTYATGKRKNAIAKVWLKKGEGNITINGKDPLDYLKRPLLVIEINSPFVVTKTEDKYDIICQALGGGLSGQAGAIRLAISKALESSNPEAFRLDLKRAGFLTRDARVVERKKAGLIKARKGQVYKRR